MYKTVLLATDFSINSTHAIRYGLRLFDPEDDVSFILFNAYQDHSMGTSITQPFEDQMRQISMQMLERMKENLEQDYGLDKYNIGLANQYGDLVFAVEMFCQREEIDLIIIGNSGAGGPSLSVYGRTTVALMKDSPVPVLSIPLQTSIATPKRLAIASDIQLTGEEDFLEPILDFASLTSAEVVGLQIRKPQDGTALSDGHDAYPDPDALPYISLEIEDPLTGIEMAIGEEKLDLVAILIKKRSLIQSLFHRSVTKRLVKEVSVPLLSIPQP